MRTTARHPWPRPRRSGAPAALHCAIPRTYLWAGPARRNTAQAQERARTAGELLNVGSLGGQDNPPRPLAGAAWPTRGAGITSAGAPLPHDGPANGALGALVGWLVTVKGRLGDQLFAINDAEAYWRRWQVTKVHGGLGRFYRDPLFDTLRLSGQVA